MRRCLFFCVLMGCGGAVDNIGDGIARETRAPDQVTEVAPSTPKGILFGSVFNFHGATPLVGATITVNGVESAQAATDDNGRFRFDKLSANSPLSVVVEKQGFTRATLRATIPGTAGQFPLSEGVQTIGPIYLFPTSGSVKLAVIGFDGRTIAAPKGILEVAPAWIDETAGGRGAAGHAVIETTGQNSEIIFSGTPAIEDEIRIGGSYNVYISPVDQDNDGYFEYAGKYVQYTAAQLFTNPTLRNIVLDGASAPAGAPQIQATNVLNLVSAHSAGRNNLVPRGGPLYVLFNQRILPGSVQVELRNDIGDKVLGSSWALSPLGNGLNIKMNDPVEQGFLEGIKYSVDFTVASMDGTGDKSVRFIAPFFGGDPGQPVKPAIEYVRCIDDGAGVPGSPNKGNNNLDQGEKVEVGFTVSVGSSDFPVGSTWGVPVYFKWDLDGDGKRISSGEYPQTNPIANTPFCAANDEPFRHTGYTRRLVFTYPYPTSVPASSVIDVVIAMSEAPVKCAGREVQSVWGEAVTKAYGTDTLIKLGVRAVP